MNNNYSRNPIPQSREEMLKQLRVLFLALGGGQLMVFVVLWLNVTPPSEPAFTQEPLDYIIVGAWTAIVALGFYLTKIKLGEAAAAAPGVDQWMAYRAAQIVRYAMLEGPVLLCFVFYFFVRPNPLFLGLAGLAFVLFLLQMPSESKMEQELSA